MEIQYDIANKWFGKWSHFSKEGKYTNTTIPNAPETPSCRTVTRDEQLIGMEAQFGLPGELLTKEGFVSYIDTEITRDDDIPLYHGKEIKLVLPAP